MKKAASILFSAILLFNLIGYQLLSNYMQHQSDVALQMQLDDELYDDSELISFKLPLSIPYHNSTKDFERVDGEVKVDGMIYNYVKRRIYQDTLEVLCIVNKEKMQLQSAKDEFFQLCYDLKHSSSGKKNTSAPVAKNLQLEYCYSFDFLQISGLSPENIHHNNFLSVLLSSIYLPTAAEPPEQVSC
ncbi:MAG: hypothetical protein ABR502_12540 [Chitinophagaceae bacterium]